MQNRPLNIEPIAVTSAVTNLLNCALSSLSGPIGLAVTQPYMLLRHIRVTNNDSSSAHTLKLFKGLTGASTVGTEFAFAGTSVPANSYLDWVGYSRFDSIDFMTGVADVANKLTLTIEGEIGFS